MHDLRLYLQPGERVRLKDWLPPETHPTDEMWSIAGEEVTIRGPSGLGNGWYRIWENQWNYYYTCFESPTQNFSAAENQIADLYS